MVNFSDEEFIERVAETAELADRGPAPSRLKAKLYSTLMQRAAETGPLLNLRDTKACGHKLCIFEEFVRIAPVNDKAKSLNICRACHARMLAEHMENAPIYWSGCPYVALKNS